MGFLLTGNDFGQWKPFEQLHPAEFRQRVSYIRAVQVHNITYITYFGQYYCLIRAMKPNIKALNHYFLKDTVS